MREYDEIRFQYTPQALRGQVRYKDLWYSKDFPAHWTANDVLARIGLMEDPRTWKAEQKDAEIQALRHLLFQTHFGEGHTPVYDGTNMRCDACRIDFVEDTVEEIAKKQVIANHRKFVKHIQEQG